MLSQSSCEAGPGPRCGTSDRYHNLTHGLTTPRMSSMGPKPLPGSPVEQRRSVFDVMVLTNSRSRLEHLWKAACSEVPEDRRDWYLFGTFEIFQPKRFHGQSFLTLRREQVGVLDDDASEGTRNIGSRLGIRTEATSSS